MDGIDDNVNVYVINNGYTHFYTKLFAKKNV